MNVSVWWEVCVLKRGVTVGTRTWHLLSKHSPWLPPTPLASVASDSVERREGLQSSVQETCSQVLALRESEKEARVGVKRCVKDGGCSGEWFTRETESGICSGVGDKTLFKSAFQRLTKRAWFTSDLSYLNLLHANGWTLPSYQRRTVTCLSLIKETLQVLIIFCLPTELKVVAGSSHLSRNRSPGFSKVSADLLQALLEPSRFWGFAQNRDEESTLKNTFHSIFFFQKL